MRVQQLGHAVLKVRDTARAEAFYNGVLGLPIAARRGTKMTFFTLGNHHDLAVIAVDPEAPNAPSGSPGLLHLAFKVGTTEGELRAVKQELEAAGVEISYTGDKTVTMSLYLQDPDGNGIELYVDTSDVWKTDPRAVATPSVPLTFDPRVAWYPSG
jgi:catechol 2,3-dioxygenase